jgi:predicted phage-related endonuclease
MTELDRRTYIGGSSIAAVVNLDPRRTALDLWFSMTASEPPLPPDPKLAKFFKRRARQEPVIAEMLADDFGVEVTRLSYGNPNRYSDPDYAFMAAEIDFEFRMTDRVREHFPDRADFLAVPDGAVCNGEIKTHYFWLGSKYGEEGSEDVPIEYAAQSLWGLGITRRPACLVAALFGVDQLSCYPIVADEGTIAWLRQEAIKFWNENVLARVAPEPVNLDDILNLYRRYTGRPVELDEATAGITEDIFRLNEQKRVLDEGLEDKKFRLFDYVRKAWGIPADPTAELPGDNAILLYEGRPFAVWRRQNGTSLDQKRLRADHPEIVKEYDRRTTFRVLARPPKPKRGKS